MTTPFVPDASTKVCVSIAKNPGTFGSQFHNFLARELKLNYLYFARCINSSDLLPDFFKGVRALNFRGCSVSMPYKKDCMKFVDQFDESAKLTGCLNTIVNENNVLTGYNTDYLGIERLLSKIFYLDKSDCVEILGSGSVSQSVLAALVTLGFSNIKVRSRNATAALALQNQNKFQHVYWDDLNMTLNTRFIINATSIGFKATDDFIFPINFSNYRNCKGLFDVVSSPAETNLIKEAKRNGLKTICGLELAKIQSALQFELYSGVKLNELIINRAYLQVIST